MFEFVTAYILKHQLTVFMLDLPNFKMGTDYTIKLDNWKLFSKQKLLSRQFTRLCYIKV